MDEHRFDSLTRTLAGEVNRRRVLRGAAMGLAAAIGLRASRAGAGQAKLPICHYTGSESNPWEVIEVAEPAYVNHVAHGDHAYIDCCDDSACSGSDTCGGGGVEGQCGSPSPCQVYEFSEPVCFWMENYTGHYCFVPTETELGVSYNEAECAQAGSGCQFGGGCYKFDTTSY